MSAFRRVLVPVDFSPPSASALRLGPRFAKASGGSVDIAHVYPFRKSFSNAALEASRPLRIFAGAAPAFIAGTEPPGPSARISCTTLSPPAAKC